MISPQHWDVLMKFFLFQPPNIQWLVSDIAEKCVQPARWSTDIGHISGDGC